MTFVSVATCTILDSNKMNLKDRKLGTEVYKDSYIETSYIARALSQKPQEAQTD